MFCVNSLNRVNFQEYCYLTDLSDFNDSQSQPPHFKLIEIAFTSSKWLNKNNNKIKPSECIFHTPTRNFLTEDIWFCFAYKTFSRVLLPTLFNYLLAVINPSCYMPAKHMHWTIQHIQTLNYFCQANEEENLHMLKKK